MCAMAEYRVTWWRTIPSLVTARGGNGQTSKSALPDRFQEAIDALAMRTGAADSDAYLAGWEQGEWTVRDGEPAEVATAVARELDEAYPHARLSSLVEAWG
jgi:hypothetical protein